MRYKKNIVILFSILVLFGIVCFLNYHYKLYAINFHSEETIEDQTFSIMTFNVNSLDSITFSEEKQKKLLDLICEEHPDILCMQELTFENLKRIKPQLDSIYGPCDTLKGDNQLWRLRLYSAYPLRNFRRHKCMGYFNYEGLELIESEQKEIEQFQKQMNVMSAELEVAPGHWVTFFSGHLRSSAYSTARRAMDKDASWTDGLSLYWRNYKVGKRIRDYEAENVRRFIYSERVAGKPVIVTGDLNDWCGSTTLNTLMGEGDNVLKDAWWEGGNGFGFTYQGWHLRLRLDHILYGNGLELQDVKVIDSD